jgi:hypothetical protein
MFWPSEKARIKDHKSTTSRAVCQELMRKRHRLGWKLTPKESLALNCSGPLIKKGENPLIAANKCKEMREFILNDITTDKGEAFFNDLLGFIAYKEIEGTHNPHMQQKNTQRVEQPYDQQKCKKEMPHFRELHRKVEDVAIDEHDGLEIMYFDILVQHRTSSTGGVLEC